MSDWFDGGGSGQAVDVEALLDGPAADGLWGIVAAGALVSLGTTSDGGALGVTITVDGRWRREYFRDSEGLCSWLAEAVPAVRAAREGQAASSARGRRQRSTRGL
jgi:hypothetical protein